MYEALALHARLSLSILANLSLRTDHFSILKFYRWGLVRKTYISHRVRYSSSHP